MQSIETVTILITDLVGSTRLASRVGQTAADDLRHEHFGLLRDAIVETGGTEVKNTGDGLMVAFRSSSAAVDCAIAMQQRVTRRNRSSAEPLHIRIGLGMGDATVEDGDYFGMPSVEAARLCDQASADGILASELVTMMARRSSEVFSPVGPLTLKGIPDPASVFEVRWNQREAAGGLPLPQPLTVRPRLAIRGRESQLAALEAAWHAAAAGTGGVALVSGEPGMGKTRLLVEMALTAHDDGATVLFGRCQEGVGMPYQPLLEAVRHYTSVCPPPRLTTLREHSAILTRLAPELAAVLPGPVAGRVERRSEQRRIADAMVAVLVGAARHVPTLLVLDDVHAARPPLLPIVRRLAEAAESQPVLLIAAYRDTEVGTHDPLSDLVVDLRRGARTHRVTVGSLGEEDVAELMTQACAGRPATDAVLVRELTRFTGGSPLLITELLAGASLADGALARIVGCLEPWDPGAAGLPQHVTETIHARLHRTSEACNRVLDVAAVIGDAFEAPLVAQVAGVAEGECLEALDEALAAGLLRAQTGSIRRFAFTSALVRHAIYSAQTTPQRVRAHRAVAEAIEAIDSDRLTEIAEHWFAATALAGIGAQHLSRAIQYAERAGRRAADDAHFSQAGRQFRHAAQLVEAREAGSRRHCELLLEAGRSFAQADQTLEAKGSFRRAAEMARRAGDPQLLASAALGHGMGVGDAFYVSGVDEPLVGLLEEALAGLHAGHGPLRVRVLSRLAVELHLTGFVERREVLSRQAVELAQSLADPEAELVALYGWLTANWSPDDLPGRLAGSDEVIRRAGDLHDAQMVYEGHDMKLRALLELGDMAAVDKELAEMERIAGALGKPLYDWHVRSCRAMRALHAGAADEAQRWMREALELGSRADLELAQRCVQEQAALRHWVAGPPGELIPILRYGVQSCPWLPVRRAGLAFGLADLGRKTEAIAEFERLAQEDFATLPHDGNWLLTMGLLSFACAALGDTARASVLTAALEPYGERFLVGGDATTTWGPVSTALAVLAMTLGSYDAAADRFERAIEQCVTGAAEAQKVVAQYEFARMLAARGRSRDSARAASLLADASSTCARRGFHGLATRVASLAGGR